MKSKNTKTKISAGDVLIRTILILVVLIVAALLALLLYGVIAKGYGIEEIIAVVRACWERAEVYIPSIVAVFSSTTAVAAVKLGQLISAANRYNESVKGLENKNDVLEKLFVDTVKEINVRYKKAQDIEREKNDLNQKMLLLLSEAIYDEEIKKRLDELHQDYTKLCQEEENLLKEGEE